MCTVEVGTRKEGLSYIAIKVISRAKDWRGVTKLVKKEHVTESTVSSPSLESRYGPRGFSRATQTGVFDPDIRLANRSFIRLYKPVRGYAS
jgi:hypothetical protein